jgi:hypothetical protein
VKTQKIVIEVIWRPTESMQNANMLADELSDLIEEALEKRDMEGAAFASPVER